MKKFLLLAATFISICMQINAQNYTVGVPVNDTLVWGGTNADTCYPIPSADIYLPANTVTGISFIFVINVPNGDSIIINGITYYSGMHSVPVSTAIEIYNPSGIVVGGPIIATGIPLVANEPYHCGPVTFISTGSFCPTDMDCMFPDTCFVLPFDATPDHVNRKILWDISASPNPFHNFATLKIKGIDLKIRNSRLKIYNMMGTLISEEEIPNITSYTLHRGSLNNGLYFFELRTNDYEPIGSGKFVVE